MPKMPSRHTTKPKKILKSSINKMLKHEQKNRICGSQTMNIYFKLILFCPSKPGEMKNDI